MAEKVEKKSAGTKLNNFLEEKRKFLLPALIIIVCVILGYVIGSIVTVNLKNKNLNAIDQITYELVNESSALDEAAIDTRRNEAIEKLSSYVKKSGITGVRANMLCADLLFQQKKYEEAAACYSKIASLKKKAYTATLANFNLGVCYEELKKLDEAAESYKKAFEADDKSLSCHAQFSYGRVLEQQGKYAEAVEAYKKLNDTNPNEAWSDLAKTRIIALQAEGKAE